MGKKTKNPNKASKNRLTAAEKSQIFQDIKRLLPAKRFEEAKKLFDKYDKDDAQALLVARANILKDLPEMRLSDSEALMVLEVLGLDKDKKETLDLISMHRGAPQLIPAILSTSIQNKKFKTVENVFKQLSHQPKILSQKCQKHVLESITVEFEPKSIALLLDAAKIKLSEFTFSKKITLGAKKPIEVSFSATEILIDLLYEAWQNNPKKAQAMLTCFTLKGLDINALQTRNNALLYSINAYHQEPDFLGFIKFLLNSNKINVNATVTNETDPMSIHLASGQLTPLSMAIGTVNRDLCLALIEAGAHPRLATKSMSSSSTTFVPAELGVENLSPQEFQNYMSEIESLIHQSLFQKLLKTIENERAQQREQEEHTIKDQAQDDSSSLAPISTEASRNGPADQEQADAEERDLQAPAAQEQDGQGEILQQYIEHLNNASQNEDLSTDLRNERKFDALVLQYIQTENEEILEEIYEFLSERSAEDGKSYINVLLQLGASVNLAGEVLAAKPQLLHKFCSAKKRVEAAEEPMDVMVTQQHLAPGIYQVPGKKIFLKLSSDVKDCLETGESSSFGQKVLKQLEDPKFIAAKSLGLSGIKSYGKNIFKLKITGQDANLVSTKNYIDESGNLLIEFDQILKHKEIKGIQGERVEMDDIGHMIFAPMVMEVRNEDSTPEDFSLATAAPSEEEEMSLTGDGPVSSSDE